MDDREDGCLIQILIVAVLCFVSALIGYGNGRDTGAKLHAAGKLVVVDLPDGTQKVCEVKEASK